MDELPSDAMVTIDHAGLPPGDAMANGADAAELLDIEMDEFAWVLALITLDRFGGLQGTKLVGPPPFEDAADGGRRNTNFNCDLFAGVALAAQALDGSHVACGVWLSDERGREE